MQGIIGGVLLVAVFAGVALAGILAVVRLYQATSPAPPGPARPGSAAESSGPRPAGESAHA